MDPREWRRLRSTGERQPGPEREFVPMVPAMREWVSELQRASQRRRGENAVIENGYRGGGPLNIGPRLHPFHDHDQLMTQQVQAERTYNNNRRNGGYGQDHIGVMVSPHERRNMDPREVQRYEEQRRRREYREAHRPRPSEFNPMYDVPLDPRARRAGTGPAEPMLDPRQAQNPNNRYVGRRDGGMDPRFYDTRMDGPRWIRK